MRTAREQWVVSEGIAGSVYDGKKEGLQPSGPTFWVRGKDGVVRAGLEPVFDSHGILERICSNPAVVVEDEWRGPSFSC